MPPENPFGGTGIQPQVFFPSLSAKPAIRDQRAPLGARQIVVWQRNPVPGIADPIHEPKGRDGEKSFAEMVLHQHHPPRDARAFAEQLRGIVRVVQNVDAGDDIHRPRGQRQRSSIESVHRNRGPGPHYYVDTSNRDVWPQLLKASGEPAVAASNIQHVRPLGDVVREQRCETPQTGAVDQPAVQCIQRGLHRRFMPRMLIRKEEKMVWTPSAVSVTPGMTVRMVRA